MAKYLVHGSYSTEGLKGLLKDGGSKRREVVDRLIQGMGGTLEAFYYAFGDNDLYIIADLPDNVTGAAAVIAVNATGTFQGKTVVLLTPEEVDQAAKKIVNYTPPGQ